MFLHLETGSSSRRLFVISASLGRRWWWPTKTPRFFCYVFDWRILQRACQYWQIHWWFFLAWGQRHPSKKGGVRRMEAGCNFHSLLTGFFIVEYSVGSTLLRFLFLSFSVDFFFSVLTFSPPLFTCVRMRWWRGSDGTSPSLTQTHVSTSF